MTSINAKYNIVNSLGHAGENGVRDVAFDLSEFSDYGSGVYMLIHQRANDFAPYIVEDY